MAKGFKHGAGGSPLNFKVVAYATEEELKAATPKENTIGVVTSNKITSWVFKITEPETPEEGMVWIRTGTNSVAKFNALKNNELSVYPTEAKQYISGAFITKPAQTYQDGSWKSWELYLYKAGDECTDITGGWTNSGFSFNNGTADFTVTAPTKNSDHMLFKGTAANSYKVCGASTKNLIDVTGYNFVNYEVNLIKIGASNGNHVVLKSKKMQDRAGQGSNPPPTGFKIIQIPLPVDGGSYYVGSMVGISEAQYSIYNVWLS